MTIDQEALAARIAEVALLHGQFTLRSGRTSAYYLDKYLFSTRPEVLSELAELFASRIPQGTDRLAGAELGGIPLVTATALRSGLPCLFIRNSRKDYGTSKQLEGVLEAGDKVVLLEDVATTGGQALEAAEIMRGMGADVLKVIATIDRLEGARENFDAAGIEFESLFTKKDLGITE